MTSDTGLTHAVVDGKTMSALGVSEVHEVPWSVLQLLPQGSELSRESALLPMY
jgi:non-canonical (house-cleaning) NTP pyrophosphatase